ncbi:unnamed protein product [Meganyctiphanes norvegica]|uniref:Uncharacterized protein n=1 Tax=Meganyctiphanes norvegica TaxID=48144 RepID=A0AAV2RY15_MEGNR
MDVRRLKCVTLGHGGNGKTCLHIRYCFNKFSSQYVPTVFDNYVQNVNVKGTNVELGMFDTGGGEDYHRLRPLCYPETDFFLICSAIDNRSALRDVEEEWYPEIFYHCPKVLKFLVGTKVDLRSQEAEGVPKSSIVTYEEGLDMAKRLGLTGYMECSSLTGDGVSNVFNKAIEEVLNQQMMIKKKKEKCLLI